MDERILAKKTVTRTYVIGDHEYGTLDEAKAAALKSLLCLSVPDTEKLILNGPEIATILLSKGHKKRGPRKKKAPPVDDHPILPIPGLVPTALPVGFDPTPTTKSPAPRMPGPAPKPVGVPNLDNITLPPCNI